MLYLKIKITEAQLVSLLPVVLVLVVQNIIGHRHRCVEVSLFQLITEVLPVVLENPSASTTDATILAIVPALCLVPVQ
jgi:hypothetical protein